MSKQANPLQNHPNKSNSVAVYPGSFDPITMGHIDIIQRIARQFGKLVVLIAESPDKKALFTTKERKAMIETCLTHLPNVEVDIHEGLTVEYVRQKQAHVIVRGLRAVSDFEYEVSMANMNAKLAPEIETLIIFARPEYYFLSSRSVKEVAKHGGELTGLVPGLVKTALEKAFSKG